MIELNRLRSEIELLDAQLIALLSRRQELTFFIGIEKQRLQLAVEQLDYWNASNDKRLFIAKKMEVSETFVKELFEVIHAHSKRTQEIRK